MKMVNGKCTKVSSRKYSCKSWKECNLRRLNHVSGCEGLSRNFLRDTILRYLHMGRHRQVSKPKQTIRDVESINPAQPGKSYTMGTDITSVPLAGDVDGAGIIPRAITEIFTQIDKRVESAGNKLQIDAQNSYIEIYNEELIDLLVGDLSPGEKPQVTIREDKAGHIIWSGLREVRVNNASDVMQ